MVHIGFRANIRIFHFSKIAHTYVTCQVRPWTTVAKWSDLHAVLERCLLEHRIAYDAAITKHRLVYCRSWANTTKRTNARLACNHCTGENNGISANFNIRVDIGSCRIDDRHTRVHMPFKHTPAQQLFGLSQLHAIIDTNRLVKGAAHSSNPPSLRTGNADQV